MELRRVRSTAFWAAMVPAPLWALIRAFGWEAGWLRATPATQVVAFTPYAAVLSVVPLGMAAGWVGVRGRGQPRRRSTGRSAEGGAALGGTAVASDAIGITAVGSPAVGSAAGRLVVLRQWCAVITALAATAALLGCVVPRAVGSAVPASARDGMELRLLTVNLSLGEADLAAVVRVVRDQHVDVLALQEFTPQAESAIDQAGISALLPYRNTHPSALAAGSALFARYPLQEPDVRKNWGGFYQVHATITVPGARPVLAESVHVCSPFSLGQLHCWRTDLAREPHPADGVPLRVLAGDFNATLDHAPLRSLIGHGYRDAADSVGAGWVGTWGPYTRHPFIPPVTLDHVLADRQIGVRGVQAFGIARTDHRAVLAVLVVPRGEG
jgi:endonuclease/exonuclease/phosphatase family metal-dependent hydrolase